MELAGRFVFAVDGDLRFLIFLDYRCLSEQLPENCTRRFPFIMVKGRDTHATVQH